MKKWVVFLFLICCTTFCFAQRAEKKFVPEQRAEVVTNWMNQKLSLSSKQRSKLFEVNVKYAQVNEKVFNVETDNQKILEQELKSNEEKRERDYRKILTRKQFNLFQSEKKQLTKPVEKI